MGQDRSLKVLNRWSIGANFTVLRVLAAHDVALHALFITVAGHFAYISELVQCERSAPFPPFSSASSVPKRVSARTICSRKLSRRKQRVDAKKYDLLSMILTSSLGGHFGSDSGLRKLAENVRAKACLT